MKTSWEIIEAIQTLEAETEKQQTKWIAQKDEQGKRIKRSELAGIYNRVERLRAKVEILRWVLQ